VSVNRVPESQRICTGRVVGVIKRNWRQYCGIIKKSIKAVGFILSVVVAISVLFLPYLVNFRCGVMMGAVLSWSVGPLARVLMPSGKSWIFS